MKSSAWVCGLGDSGLAACRLLRREGFHVAVLDENDSAVIRQRTEEAIALGCEVFHTMENFFSRFPHYGNSLNEVEFAVVSPGISPQSSLLEAIRRENIPIVSELEFGWSHHAGRTIAVTGSNGKSSVVKWLAESIQMAGLRAIPCGNYGLPVCQAVLNDPDADWLVMEVSTFQLETCIQFRPDIGILLNILPNHLDRHGDMETYIALKARLFARQQAGDLALVPPEWRMRIQTESGGKGLWKTFSGEMLTANIRGSYFDNDILRPHADAVFQALTAAQIPIAAGEKAVRHFQPLPHRSQRIAEKNGVIYIDDSKATNLAAMIASIRMAGRPVRLIAGGRAKETDFSAAIPVLQALVRKVYLIGEAAPSMQQAWQHAIPCEDAETLDQATQTASHEAAEGEAVLLAPACTSYDQFFNYHARGNHFQTIVRELLSSSDSDVTP